MNQGTRIGARVAAVLSLSLATAICQQTPRAQAREHIRTGRFADALAVADAALQSDPDSHDWHFLRAEVLVRLGRLAEVATSRDHLVRLHEQRMRQLARWLEQGATAAPVAAGASSPTAGGANESTTPTGPGATKRAIVGAPRTENVLAAERLLDRPPAPPGKSPAKANPALASVLTKVATDANRQAKEGDKDASKRLAEVVLAAAGERPQESADALGELAKSSDPAIAEAALRQLRLLFDTAIAQAIAAFNAGEDAAGEQWVEESSRVGDMLFEQHDRGHVLDGARRLAGAGLQNAVAAGLRLVARTCDKWAAVIEQASLDGAPDAAQQGAELRSVIVSMHGDPHTRSVAGEHMRQLGQSRNKAVADPAKAQLAAWATQHVADGRAAEQRGDDKVAADELEQASVCDPELTQEAYDAAMLHESAGQPGRAVRIYKRLLLTTAGIVAEQSRTRLAALWQKSKAALPRIAFKPDQNRKTAESHRLLDQIAESLPVLEGPELVALHDLIDKGLTTEVDRRLQELLESVGKNDPTGPIANPAATTVPRIGADFTLAGASVPCRWVQGSGDEPGFWRLESVVTADLWCAVLDNEKTPTKNAPDGDYVKRSWDSAMLLCSKLTAREREAGRLPAGYAYSLPSKARLEQLRDGTGRLPGASGLSLWTTDAQGVDPDVPRPMRIACSCDPGGGATPRTCWQNHPMVGLTIVLVREQ